MDPNVLNYTSFRLIRLTLYHRIVQHLIPFIYPQIVFADRGEIISAGNFHGEYPAKSLDYLAIGVHELAAMSERRIERLVNPAYSELPAFLVKDGGLNSGFMIAHCTAAALGKL